MKRNILLVIPNLGFGGAQRDFSKLSIELAKKYCIYVCVFNKIGGVDFPLGGKLIDMSVSGGGSVFKKLLNFIKRVKKLKAIKQAYEIDATISYLEGANYVNVLSKSNDKIIISIRGSQQYDETIKGFLGWLRKNIFIKLLYSRADKLVALNYGISKELTDIYKINADKVNIIRNYFDLEEIRIKSKENLSGELANFFDGFIICTAGRLAPEKGYFHLMNVVAEVRKVKANIKLLIIGDGPLKYQLFEYAKQLGLKPYAEWNERHPFSIDETQLLFTGYENNPFKFIAKSQLFTITSSSEGGPNILSEAMICNVPVISVDCPSGPREKLSKNCERPSKSITKAECSDYGILMPVFEQNNRQPIQEWIRVISELVDNKDILSRYVKRANQMIARYDISLMSKAWEKVM
ncbi:glycosyltransferase [Catalinimonas alkaloidigena]|uniref:glycosyltransferase n=1 Tax=Catalinimonas alkaloidigena TaxID=1075417 RepID=UPI002404D84A|nr:glycosyltransferase [Catalinimonas alkaloidigena]